MKKLQKQIKKGSEKGVLTPFSAVAVFDLIVSPEPLREHRASSRGHITQKEIKKQG